MSSRHFDDEPPINDLPHPTHHLLERLTAHDNLRHDNNNTCVTPSGCTTFSWKAPRRFSCSVPRLPKSVTYLSVQVLVLTSLDRCWYSPHCTGAGTHLSGQVLVLTSLDRCLYSSMISLGSSFSLVLACCNSSPTPRCSSCAATRGISPCSVCRRLPANQQGRLSPAPHPPAPGPRGGGGLPNRQCTVKTQIQDATAPSFQDTLLVENQAHIWTTAEAFFRVAPKKRLKAVVLVFLRSFVTTKLNTTRTGKVVVAWTPDPKQFP